MPLPMLANDDAIGVVMVWLAFHQNGSGRSKTMRPQSRGPHFIWPSTRTVGIASLVGNLILLSVLYRVTQIVSMAQHSDR
ncbi:hypothetical protein BDW71DRAFT_184001 [Aspergillus fruticulosus]